MNRRTLSKYAIYSIAVLSAALINGLVIDYVRRHIDQKGYLLVLIDMLIVVLIFAPTFALVAKYTKKLSRVYIYSSNKLSSTKNGRFVGFAIALIALFVLYALLRHNIDVLDRLKTMISS
ncbi:hypothetical protein ACFQ1M_08275 [Sungkyunkwania multivorans]|uniref:Uncharacterized protein n=1 Tax=Sungkyunkwania multivorans TaxID=1173618 RepID=A0ABW3D045_9FLAO